MVKIRKKLLSEISQEKRSQIEINRMCWVERAREMDGLPGVSRAKPLQQWSICNPPVQEIDVLYIICHRDYCTTHIVQQICKGKRQGEIDLWRNCNAAKSILDKRIGEKNHSLMNEQDKAPQLLMHKKIQAMKILVTLLIATLAARFVSESPHLDSSVGL